MAAYKVEDHYEISEEDVRSGQTGMHLRHILAVSLVLVVAAFTLVAILN